MRHPRQLPARRPRQRKQGTDVAMHKALYPAGIRHRDAIHRVRLEPAPSGRDEPRPYSEMFILQDGDLQRKETTMQKMVLPGQWDNGSIPPPLPTRRGSRRPKKRKLVIATAIVLLALFLTGGSTFALFKHNPSLLSNMVNHGKQKNQYNMQNNGMQNNGPSSMMMDNQGRVATTINNLTRISVVGSTAFILDGHGHTISADANPYGIVIAPNSMVPGALRPGDILVTNFGRMNTGTTLVRFPAGKGPGLLFNTMTTPG